MGKLYLRLDGAFANEQMLAKPATEDYFTKPLEEVIRYVCNHTPDALNPENSDNPGSCYPAPLVEKAGLIEEAMDAGFNQPQAEFEVQAEKADGSGLIKLGKNKDLYDVTLSQFRDDIVKKETMDSDEFSLVNLVATYNAGGGR